MKTIAFIKGCAFIISILAKLIALPFVLLGTVLKTCWKGFRKGVALVVWLCCWLGSKIHLKFKRTSRHIEPKKSKIKREQNSLVIKALKCIYRKFYNFFRKCYWATRGILQKCYWTLHSFYRKCYWVTRGILQKIYWRARGLAQKVYWKYYTVSRVLFRYLRKSDSLDLFFIFLRGYLKNDTEKVQYMKLCSIKEYVKRHSNTSSYQVIEEEMARTVCIPEYFEKGQECLERYTSPEIYIAKIAEVTLIGGSSVVIAGEMLLNDAAYYDTEHRLDIRFAAIKKVFKKVAIVEEYGEAQVLEKGINLVAAASFNYYHLLVEVLSGLAFVDSCEEYRGYPILIDEVVLRIPQFRAALDCVNKYDHPIIKIECNKKYLIKSLVIPSSNVWMPINVYERNMIRTQDFLIADTVLKHMRSSVKLFEEKAPWRKIFISRKNTKAVRLKNEEEVREIFQQHDFEIIYAEEMTFEQQIECFGQAKCVIATSGAALTNIMFCQPQTIIGCIIPAEHRFYMYSTIAHMVGLRPVFLDAELVKRTPYTAADTFVLDEGYVKRYIQYIEEQYIKLEVIKHDFRNK